MSNVSKDLQGRVALITGGARGIGRAVAEMFVTQGASVVVNDSGVDADGTNPDSSVVAEVVESLIASGGQAVGDDGDIGDTAVGERLVETALETFGRLDVVVNVAGILRDRMVFNMTDEEWDDVIRTHLRGHFSAIRPAARYWRSQKNPDGHYRIINFTSDSGLQGSPGQPNYSAAKLGVVGLTLSLAHSLAKYGVTANAVAPGAVTRMMATIPDDKKLDSIYDTFTAENVATLIRYLADTNTDWLTGRVLGVAGYDVRLFSTPEVIAELHGNEPWTMNSLAEQFESIIRPLADGLATNMFTSQL